MSQDKLAERLDVSTQWLSRAENGHENLTIETLVRVANAIGVNVVELFQDSEETPVRIARPGARKRQPLR